MPNTPIIYTFYARSPKLTPDVVAYALAQDGTYLGTHISSDPDYARSDVGERPHRLIAFGRHYPEGYVVEWVGEEPAPGVNPGFDEAVLRSESVPFKTETFGHLGFRIPGAPA